MPAFLSQKGVEGERKENSPVDCFLRESYTNLSLHTRRNKQAGTILFAKHTSGTPKKAGAVRCLLFCLRRESNIKRFLKKSLDNSAPHMVIYICITQRGEVQ